MPSLKEILIVALILVQLPLQAQESLSLQQALTIALEDNFDIRIAQNNAAIAKNNHSIGEAGFLPNVALLFDQAGSVNNIRQEFLTGNVLENPSAAQQSLNINALMNWTIFDGMAMFTSYKRLGELESMGKLQAKAAIEQVMADVTMTYFEIIQRKQQLEVAVKSASISEERLKLAEQRYQLGSSSKLESLQAKVDFNADRTAFLQQLEAYKLSKIALNVLLSREVTLDFMPTDSMQPVQPLEFADLRNQAEKQNTWLAVAGLNQKVADLNRQQISGEMLPQIDLIGGYHFNRLQSEAGFLASNQNRGVDFGVRASINVFDGFRVQRQRQNARIQIMSADIAFEQQKQRIMSALSSTYTAFDNNRVLVEMETENLEIAAQNMEVANDRYKLGALPAIELREAQRQYVASESRLIQARFLLMVNQTELLRLSGQLLN